MKVARRFGQVLESPPDATAITDRVGRITLINHLAQTLFGYGRGAPLGRSVEFLIPALLRCTYVRHRQRRGIDLYSRDMGQGRDITALRPDGTAVSLEIGLSPMRCEGDRLVIAAIRDLAEHARTTEALCQSEERFPLLV